MNFPEIWLFKSRSLLNLVSGWLVFCWDKAFSNDGNEDILDDVYKENNETVKVDLRQHEVNQMQVIVGIVDHVSVEHSKESEHSAWGSGEPLRVPKQSQS